MITAVSVLALGGLEEEEEAKELTVSSPQQTAFMRKEMKFNAGKFGVGRCQSLSQRGE